MHRRCRHDSSEKSSTFARFANSTQTFLDSDRKGHEYCKDDSNVETQSQDEIGCDSSETGHGLTARYDFKIQHCSRSLLPGDVAPLESEVKYGWPGEDLTFDPGGHNLVRKELCHDGSQSPQPVDVVPSEPQKFGSGENVTFDPGGQNPVDHAFFQHGCRLFQPACDVSNTTTFGSDANARHKCVDRRSGKTSTSQENLVYVFQPRSLTRNERSRFSDEDLNIPASAAFVEPETTIREKENGVLDLCYLINSFVFFVFGNDCGTEHQFKELRLRRTKHLGCWNGSGRSFWTNDFGLDCYDTRPINMGWDVAFIFEIEESPFIYNVCVIEWNNLKGKRKGKCCVCQRKKKRKKWLKIFGALALHGSLSQSLASSGFRIVCPLDERFSTEIKPVQSSKIHMASSNDVTNGFTEPGKKIITSDLIEFCKRVCLVRGRYKCQRIYRPNLSLSCSLGLYMQSNLPSHIEHVDKTCVSGAGSGKQVLDWRELLSDVVLSGYRRICCISDSSRGESIVDGLRLDLMQYGCQVLNIDDSRFGMSELSSVEECLLSCDCVVVLVTQQDVSREVEFSINMVIASGQLRLYSVVTSFDLIKYLPFLLKPFPIVTMEVVFTARDLTLFSNFEKYRTLRYLSYDEWSLENVNRLVSFSCDRIRVLMDEDDSDANETLRRILHPSCYVINDDDIPEGKPIFTELARELYADRMFVVIPPKSEPSPVYCFALRLLCNRMGFTLGEIPFKSCSAPMLIF